MASNGGTPAFKTQLFINNEYVDAKSGESFPVHNPHDESVLHPAIPVAGKADIDAAVDGAHAAFKTGPWRSYTAKQRAAIMNKFADLIEAHVEELGKLETLAMGQPAGISSFIVRWGVDTWRYYAGWADKIAGQTFPEEDGTYRIVRYEPLGVCAGVGAWNASPR
ncbi:hypothetical protein MPH_00585 [Macrophomina phaseolina MS6]|uniref:aldehyde dehydrogenase (NAD(+)) n=1 Tax=Macrophomina phaseolina (strain MS6) TaxID=1126212 RepID=K2SZQ5_MACPH|nr:hypothetical protein MPH_00585 [Macrophomina phaseolina MS6]